MLIISLINYEKHTNSSKRNFKLCKTYKHFNQNMKLNTFNLQYPHRRCCHKDYLPESDIR